ncbi:cell envelope integrity protein CreD [Shewanella insulae]|uniref:cell envelope integrity protein CreD n=1 Tax=Shewanella insulae TaxID=2681496 RepID=UPI001EFCF1F9|nr:cell envelope integrity protein CreD [Shewanella insulae]MCG9757002.1 cell envelope integrity protein CreD [Shewanella insulae]
MLSRLPLANSPLSKKLIFIAILTLVAMIPLGLIESLTSDRQHLYHGVVNEIGRSWGEQQTIAGPALVIPYTYEVVQESISDTGKMTKARHTYDSELVVLPEQLNLAVSLKHSFLSRGIFRSLVYKSQVTGSAQFRLEAYTLPNLVSLHPDQARLVFGISANQAIDKINRFTAKADQQAATPQRLMPGTRLEQLRGLNRGFHQPITLHPESKQLTVNFDISLRGSQGISVLPIGQQTEVTLSADWPHPSFHGLLPTERQITAQGFSAQWDVSHLTRNYPQVFTKTQEVNLQEIAAQATLFEPVTHYGKIERAVKYGLLFIMLTSIMLLIFELGQQQVLSSIQYLLVASAMALFYLLLLSLSEHISFGYAYLLAASVPLVSVSAYIASVTASRRRGIFMAIMLLALYSVLYSILKLEDYALLMGSGLLMMVLLILMYLTRHRVEDPSTPQQD